MWRVKERVLLKKTAPSPNWLSNTKWSYIQVMLYRLVVLS